MERKDRILELLERGYALEREFCTGLSERDRSLPGTWEQWAAKDSLAHSAAWRKRLADGLAEAAQGRELSPADDYQHQNEVIFEEHRARSWNEVESMAAEAHKLLVERVSRLTEQELNSTTLLPWQRDRAMWQLAVGTGFNHPLIHVSDHLKQSGQIERAAAVIGELATAVADLDDSAEWQGIVHYNLACHHALLGEKQAAIDRLGEALELSPRLLEHSREDPDLDAIRTEPACQALIRTHEELQGEPDGAG